MTIKFEKIQPGMTLWTTERRRMGNTAMRETVAVGHFITHVDVSSRVVTFIRDGRESRASERHICRMRATNPTCPECRKTVGHHSTCSKRRRAAEAESTS